MLRADFINVNEDLSQELSGGIVLHNGELIHTEGNRGATDILLSDTLGRAEYSSNEEYLAALSGLYSNGSQYYVSEMYDDLDSRYDDNGIYVGDEDAGWSIDLVSDEPSTSAIIADADGIKLDRDNIRGRGDGPTGPHWWARGSTRKISSDQTIPDISEATRKELDEIEQKYPPVNPNGTDTLSRQQDEDGNFSAEREELHQELINKVRAKATPVEDPEFVLLGGGPAAGKSTALGSGDIVIDPNSVVVNADDFKSGLPEFKVLNKYGHMHDGPYVHEESSFLAKETLRRSLFDKHNTVLDGTGDSSYDSVVTKVQRARASGHRVRAEYVTCKTESAIERSLVRASKPGGRKVPERVLRETHRNVSRVVPQALHDGLFDSFNLWDTEVLGERPVHVASAQGRDLTVLDPVLWQAFLDKGK